MGYGKDLEKPGKKMLPREQSDKSMPRYAWIMGGARDSGETLSSLLSCKGDRGGWKNYAVTLARFCQCCFRVISPVFNSYLVCPARPTSPVRMIVSQLETLSSVLGSEKDDFFFLHAHKKNHLCFLEA